MDAQVFFLEQHAMTAVFVDQLVIGGLSDADLRRQSSEDLNPLAWLLWHAARWEDVIVNAWLVQRPQVFDREPWDSRLGVRTRHVGTGMTPSEVGALAGELDLDGLRAYRTATAAATAEAIGERPAAELGEAVPVDRFEVAAADGAFRNERARWMDEFWTGHTVSWFLAFLNLHAAEHLLGEALVVRSRLGIPLGL